LLKYFKTKLAQGKLVNLGPGQDFSAMITSKIAFADLTKIAFADLSKIAFADLPKIVFAEQRITG